MTGLLERQTAGGWLQPTATGLLAALVGFASTFTIILQGLISVGATPAESASGLFAICLIQGGLAVIFGLVWRQPISIVWSTPGAALLIATGPVAGGFPAVVGVMIFVAALIMIAGLSAHFGRLVAAIPADLANAMLAGILLEICLAPVHALSSAPAMAVPVILAWALALRFTRRFAIPIALGVAVIVIALTTTLPPGLFASAWPAPITVAPHFSPALLASLGIPLFIVTMASQNVPGLAVLRANGFAPPARPIFIGTGVATALAGLFCGLPINLAAITAALCAGPDAHPDPWRRYRATVVAGLAYVVLGLFANAVTAFFSVAPKEVIAAVAGLALVGSFGSAMATALGQPSRHVPVGVTFLVTVSGVSFGGIGAPFWGLLAGIGLLALDRLSLPQAPSRRP